MGQGLAWAAEVAMVRNAAAADRRNGLLQLTKRNQLSPGMSDEEAMATGTDSAAPDDHQHNGQSVITQVLGCVLSWKGLA